MRWMLALVLAACSVHAATIVPWKQDPIHDVSVDAIRNGYVYYSSEQGNGRLKLFDVKTVLDDAPAPSTEVSQASSQAKVVDLEERQGTRRAYHVLGVAVRGDQERVRLPYVRVFTLVEDENGVRELRKFQNVRRDDPTRTAGLPTVNSSSYRRKDFLLDVNRVIAWRAEVWLDGNLAASRERNDDLGLGWWQDYEIGRTLAMKETEVRAEAPQEGPRSVPRAKIQYARIAQTLGNKGMHLSYGYTVWAKKDAATAPAATLYMLLADATGKRSVRQLSPQGKARSIAMIHGQGTQNDRILLPPEIQLSRPGARSSEAFHLVFWRLELTYADELAAQFQSPDTRIARTLPDGWWQDAK